MELPQFKFILNRAGGGQMLGLCEAYKMVAWWWGMFTLLPGPGTALSAACCTTTRNTAPLARSRVVHICRHPFPRALGEIQSHYRAVEAAPPRWVLPATRDTVNVLDTSDYAFSERRKKSQPARHSPFTNRKCYI